MSNSGSRFGHSGPSNAGTKSARPLSGVCEIKAVRTVAARESDRVDGSCRGRSPPLTRSILASSAAMAANTSPPLTRSVCRRRALCRPRRRRPPRAHRAPLRRRAREHRHDRRRERAQRHPDGAVRRARAEARRVHQRPLQVGVALEYYDLTNTEVLRHGPARRELAARIAHPEELGQAMEARQTAGARGARNTDTRLLGVARP